jgi:hypothetical protein
MTAVIGARAAPEKYGCHADQSVGSSRCREAGKQHIRRGSKSRSEHGADKQRWGEHAAGATRADGERHCQDLGHDQHQQQPEPEFAAERLRHWRIAHAKYLRQEHPEQTQRQTTWHRFEVFGYADGVERIFEPVQRAGEPDSHGTGQYRQKRIQTQLAHVDQVVRRHWKRRHVAKRGATDDRRGDAGDDDDAERTRVEFAQNDFQSEKHAGNRGVESSGDPPSGPTSHQRPNTIVGHPQRLPDGRAKS